jgi:hypothetical protein
VLETSPRGHEILDVDLQLSNLKIGRELMYLILKLGHLGRVELRIGNVLLSISLEGLVLVVLAGVQIGSKLIDGFPQLAEIEFALGGAGQLGQVDDGTAKRGAFQTTQLLGGEEGSLSDSGMNGGT